MCHSGERCGVIHIQYDVSDSSCQTLAFISFVITSPILFFLNRQVRIAMMLHRIVTLIAECIQCNTEVVSFQRIEFSTECRNEVPE